MALKTPLEYVESLRALKVNAYIGNEKVDSPKDCANVGDELPAHHVGEVESHVGKGGVGLDVLIW